MIKKRKEVNELYSKIVDDSSDCFTAGQGPDYSPLDGKFKVKYANEESKIFHCLLEAMIFYYSVKGDKALWDITWIPELIDSQYKQFYSRQQ